jgi:hypothetical protein
VRSVRVFVTTLFALPCLVMTTLSGAMASDIRQPYPGAARAHELKGVTGSDDPVVLDVTHEAALALEADELDVEARSAGPDIYAGSIWNSAEKTLTVRLTKDPAAPDARTMAMMERVGARKRDATVHFEQVARSAEELTQLARRLIDHPQTWAAGLKGRPGGGYFPAENKVILYLMAEDSPGTWIKAVERLGDPDVEVRVANVPKNGAGSAEARMMKGADNAPLEHRATFK